MLTLTSDGRLRVKDIHGGVGSNTTIILHREIAGQQVGCSGTPPPRYRVVLGLGWAQPGIWPDRFNQEALRTPGTTYEDAKLYRWSTGTSSYIIRLDRRIVHWVSADVVPTTPGFVDSSDLAAFAAHMGECVGWGPGSDCPPECSEGCPENYKFNLVPADDFQNGIVSRHIDASDLASIAADLGKHCGLTSKADGFTKEDILAWFGMLQTARTIDVAGQPLPEIAIVDRTQMERAIADPYGYKNNPIPKYTTAAPAAKRLAWTKVKNLFR